MREVRGTLIKLQPAHHAVIGQILSHARFGNAQMIGKLRLDGISAAARRASPQKIWNSNAQGLAGFHIVVAGKVGIAEQKHPRPRGSRRGLVERYRRTREQSSELHLEQ